LHGLPLDGDSNGFPTQRSFSWSKYSFSTINFLNKSIFWWFDKMGILKTNGDSFIGRKIQKQSDPIFGSELKERIKNDQVQLKDRSVSAKMI